MLSDRILDFSSQLDYVLALLPEIVLALWAMLVLIADVWQKGSRSEPSRPSIAWLAVLGLVAAAVANGLMWWTFGVRTNATEGMIVVDAFRVFTNFIFLISAALTLCISMGYLDRRGINRGEFHALVLFATLGMMLMAGSRDLMMIFIGLEVMSVAIYVLVGFDRMDARSSEASLKYFLLGAFSSAFFLYGIALLFGSVGSTHLPDISAAVQNGVPGGDLMFLAGMALTMVGFGFKVAAMPFHVWTPDAYDGAPTPVTALMATGVKAAAFAAFIRVFSVALVNARPEWGDAAFWLAVLTMFGANLVALTQGSIKRMLAYSSIAHAGYLMVALMSANDAGRSAFLFYLLVYTFMTVGAFGIVIANSRDGEERVTLEEYAGFAHQQPFMAAMFSIFLLSLAGFPLTGGFLGKMYILRSAVEGGQTVLAVLLVMASLISYFYYLRVIVVMYMRPASSEDAHGAAWLSAPARFAVATAALAVLLLFFAGRYPMQWAQESVKGFWTAPQAMVVPGLR